jgi:TonB family protein
LKEMLGQLDSGLRKSQQVALWLSFASHGVLLAWLLQGPKPVFIAPSSVVKGENGTSLTFFYRPSREGKNPAAVPREKLHLAWKTAVSAKATQPKRAAETLAEEGGSQADAADLAGSPHGSLLTGAYSGQEVRPALRISGSEPVVAFSELNGLEGSVIVEITIDERGNIVRKIVLQSLNPAIDNKVLAALEDWRFLPATRDGVAVPSKEDVYYHFPLRR